jgi:hypothetical protein
MKMEEVGEVEEVGEEEEEEEVGEEEEDKEKYPTVVRGWIGFSRDQKETCHRLRPFFFW